MSVFTELLRRAFLGEPPLPLPTPEELRDPETLSVLKRLEQREQHVRRQASRIRLARMQGREISYEEAFGRDRDDER